MPSLFPEPAAPPTDVVGYAEIAPEQGIDLIDHGLTYAVPSALADLRVGDRVLVPLGRSNKPTPAYVLAVELDAKNSACSPASSLQPPASRQSPFANRQSPFTIKPILRRDDRGLSLTPDLIELAKWMAAYYCCPLGMVLLTMLPAAVRHGTGSFRRLLVRLPPTPGSTPSPASPGDPGSPPGEIIYSAQAPQTDACDPSRPSQNAAETAPNSSFSSPFLPETHPRPTCAETPPNPTQIPPSSPPSSTNSPPSSPPIRLSALQRQVLTMAHARPAADPWIEIKHLADLAGARTIGPVKQLITKGLLLTQDQAAIRAASRLPFELSQAAQPAQVLNLSEDQTRALDRIAATISQGFSVHLLHGVTGSGKTEVYLRVIEHLMAADSSKTSPSGASGGSGGGGAIVLVPEISLTPQTVGRFVARFGDRVAVLHSGLTSAQRHQQWQGIRTGQASIVVGARSAIFAPLFFGSQDVTGDTQSPIANRQSTFRGVIIVDEEHDTSYKQDQLPRYHARDLAIKRAQILGLPVILGSATPSLESYYNATAAGRRNFALQSLPQRVAGLRLPRVEIIDLQEERRENASIFSRRLEAAMHHTLAAGGQILLLLNRRGFANYIACPDRRCGWLMSCDYCDALMVYHKWLGDKPLAARGDLSQAHASKPGLVRCHHCGAEQILPRICPVCSKTVTVFGLGTQRLEEEIGRRFPGVACQRMDADTMRSGRDYEQSLAGFRRGDVKILLGTQMIAKGLDFPNVQLVGVLSADTALHMPDFRASERTFQLVAQVAGRAGRGREGGLVIVQTFNTDEPAIVLAAKHDYEAFAQRELQMRQAAGFPPITRMARIVVRDRDDQKGAERAKQLAEALEAHNRELGLQIQLVGPMPCPIARLAEYHRQEIQLIAADAGRLQRLLAAVRKAGLLRSDLLTAVDVDPVALM